MQLLTVLLVMLVKHAFGHQPGEQCGVRKTRPLIEQGHHAYPGQFPWHVAIFQQVSKTCTDYVSGGTLISNKYVLTVARCTKSEDGHTISAKRLKVIAGLYDKEDFGSNVKQYSVSEIHRVPSEDRWVHLIKDIVLLELKSSVEFNDYIQPICLVPEDLSDSETGVVPGWGQTDHEGTSQILKFARLSVISAIECLMSNRKDYGPILDYGMICAGHQNRSVCNTDIGGGLVMKRCNSERKCPWFLVGMMSHAAEYLDGSCRSDGYGIFTKIKTYLPWISQITGLQLEDNQSSNADDQQEDQSLRTKWPWHGTLFRINSFFPLKTVNVSEAFGVTILTNQFVITTLQCAKYYKEAPDAHRVRFGHPALGFTDQFTQELAIARVYTSESKIYKDIRNLALFKLQTLIEFTKFVQPIKLWPANDSDFAGIANRTAHLVSYGRYNRGDKPQEITMPITHMCDCVLFNRIFANGYKDHQIKCAGSSNGTEPVALDIGAGLYMRRGKEWFLRGVLYTPIFDTEEIMSLKMKYVKFLDVTRFSDWLEHTFSLSSEMDRLKDYVKSRREGANNQRIANAE